MAYSPKIKDPAFDRFIKNTRNYRFQFSIGLAVLAVVGFFLYGEFGDEMENPEALYIGLVIGGMFLLIGIYSALSTRPGTDWDGEVVGKEILERGKKTFYVVYFEDSRGKKYNIRDENDPTRYEYFRLGEKIRFHGKLKTIEKFDKSKDEVIFCNACNFMNDKSLDTCKKCGCPLLK